MKTECWACGDYVKMPLSYRHWCDSCERETSIIARQKRDSVDALLKTIEDSGD